MHHVILIITPIKRKSTMLTGQFRKKMQDYYNFIRKYHGKKLVILEFGVGWRNRMIKEPLMQLTAAEPHSAISHSIKGNLYSE